MAHIPSEPPRPERLAEKSLDLSQEDYHWMVDRRMAALDIAPPAERGEHYDSALERVVEQANFLPVSYLSLGARRSQAVCRIEMSDSLGRWRSWGTGFLVAPAVVMTNNHVLEAEAWASAARLLFRDEFDEDGMPRQLEIYRLAPERLFITNKDLDFAICAVEGNPGEKYGFLRLCRDPHVISRHEHVNIIQHPSGRKKETCVQENRVAYVKTRVILYATDTEPGSSGSPVFDNAWNVVALHHSGGEQKDGVWLSNEGIRISSIVRYLDEKVADGSHVSAKAVLEHATGTNPYDGIFGAYGRRPVVSKDWPDAEKVVYNYQGADAFLDIGFWNIGRLDASSPPSRFARIADMLAQLALDALGLAEVERPAVAALVEDMNRRGFELDFVMQETPGQRGTALVYDRSTVSAEQVQWGAEAQARLRGPGLGTTSNGWNRLPLLARLTSQPERSARGGPFDFLFCAFHTKASGDGEEPGVALAVRGEAAKRLADELKSLLDASGEDDLVVSGDFNAQLDEPNSSPLAVELQAVSLTAGDARSGEPDAYTYVGSKRSSIDHVYVTPSAKTKGQPRGIDLTRIDRDIPGFRSEISDQAPIIGRFTFHERETESVEAGPPVQVQETFEVTVPVGTKRLVITIK